MADRQMAVSPMLLEQIERAIQSIRYGSVHITIHDARVVHIEKVEKVRLVPDAHLTPDGAGQHAGQHLVRDDRTSGGLAQPER